MVVDARPVVVVARVVGVVVVGSATGRAQLTAANSMTTTRAGHLLINSSQIGWQFQSPSRPAQSLVAASRPGSSKGIDPSGKGLPTPAKS